MTRKGENPGPDCVRDEILMVLPWELSAWHLMWGIMGKWGCTACADMVTDSKEVAIQSVGTDISEPQHTVDAISHPQEGHSTRVTYTRHGFARPSSRRN